MHRLKLFFCYLFRKKCIIFTMSKLYVLCVSSLAIVSLVESFTNQPITYPTTNPTNYPGANVHDIGTSPNIGHQPRKILHQIVNFVLFSFYYCLCFRWMHLRVSPISLLLLLLLTLFYQYVAVVEYMSTSSRCLCSKNRFLGFTEEFNVLV